MNKTYASLKTNQSSKDKSHYNSIDDPRSIIRISRQQKNKEVKQKIVTDKEPRLLQRFFNELNKQKLKFMHGHTVRQCSPQKKMQRFSMLHTNRDHYQTSIKKFRKYMKKNSKKQKPLFCSRSIEQIWKVLNLEGILSKGPRLIIENGKQFFNAHQRFKRQSTFYRSLRPQQIKQSRYCLKQFILADVPK